MFDIHVLRWLSRKGVLIPLVVLAVALGAALVWRFTRPTPLVVAVAPRDGIEARLLDGFARTLAEQNTDLRLTLRSYDDVTQSAEALQRREADLAVVRPDVLLPGNGLTVAILREEAAIIVAPTAAKIAEMADLQGRKLGVVARHKADPAFFATLLAYYNLAEPAVTLVPIALEQVETALRGKQVDAVAMLAAPVGQAAMDLIRRAETATDRKITVIPVSEAEALNQRYPALTPVDLHAGGLGGRPKQPAEDEKTIGITYRLMARADLDRSVVSEVAQYLFQMRSRIAQGVSAANLVKAPDIDTSTVATLPNHPGAVDYFNREQLTFMDRYGDWIWLALFSMGGVSSAGAWLLQSLMRRRRELVDEVLDRLVCILSEARAATDPQALDELSLEIDQLVTHAVRYARNRTTNTRTMSALIMAIDSARAAIADRRRDVLDDARRVELQRPRPAPRGLASSGPST